MRKKFVSVDKGFTWIGIMWGILCSGSFITYWFFRGQEPLYDQWIPLDCFIVCALALYFNSEKFWFDKKKVKLDDMEKNEEMKKKLAL